MEDIVTAACAGWLCPEVIEAILTDPEGTGFQFSLEAPTSPRNGQLYVFDSTVVKHFKLDGIDWVLKKETGRVQAVHQKITVNGVPGKITGYYSTAVHNASSGDLILRKRTYRMSEKGSTVFLVHYSLSKRYSHAKSKTEKKKSAELSYVHAPLDKAQFESNPLDYCHRCTVPSGSNFSIQNAQNTRPDERECTALVDRELSQLSVATHFPNVHENCPCCPLLEDYSVPYYHSYQRPFNLGVKEPSMQHSLGEKEESTTTRDGKYIPNEMSKLSHISNENGFFSDESEYIFDDEDIYFLNEYLSSPTDFQSQIGTPLPSDSFDTFIVDCNFLDDFSWDLGIYEKDSNGKKIFNSIYILFILYFIFIFILCLSLDHFARNS